MTDSLTKDFRETVVNRARRDPAFREALLNEIVQARREGDIEGFRSLLRDYLESGLTNVGGDPAS